MPKASDGFLYALIKSKRLFRTKLNTFFLKRVFGKIGRDVLIDPTVHYEDPAKIHLGDRVEIRKGCILIAKSDYDVGIYIGEGAHLHPYVFLNTYGGFIKLGKEVRIGAHAVLGGQGGITIGDYSGVAGLSYVIAANHLFRDTSIPFILQDVSKEGIHIGRNVWGGAGITILDGVEIGDNSVIGAGAVVHKNVPRNSVVLGNPARVVYRHGLQ